MLVAILAALGAAAAYGVSDFYGGLGAARLRVVRGTALGYLLATATAALALPLTGGVWSAEGTGWGVLAGVLAIAGMLAFYAAMVAGPISLVSPLVGVLESAVPVFTAVALGQRLGVWTWVAIVLACAGGALVSLRFGAGARMTARPILLAIVAGVTLGGSIVALDRAPADSGLQPAFVDCAVGLVVVAALLGLGRSSAAFGRVLARFDADDADASAGLAAPRTAVRAPRVVWPALVAGVLMGLANVLLVVGLRVGSLAVVSVLVDLYPVATVLLAWLVARERLSRLQLAGVVLAVAASALFAVG